MTTIYQVSELAKVSLATVSRVMNGNSRVSDKTREKVLAAMKELGYRPNLTAQSLASNRSNCVGLLVSEIHGPFFGQMMSAVETELRAAGKHVIITAGHSDEEKEKDGIEFLISRNCDAIIAHVEAVSDEYIEGIAKEKTPMIFISRYVASLADKCISLNNEYGGYLATSTMIKHGHKEIACIAGPQSKADAVARLAGHKRAMAEHNLPIKESLIYEGEFKEIGGVLGLEKFIKSNDNFTAIVCANDEIASGVMTYAREHGLHLPDDLSVIGFDNVVFASHLYPKLTTIENPVDQMGQMAAKIILRDVYKQQQDEIQHFYSPTLINRDSIADLT
ncbi:LacI family DNA-binding transcriptional regulator [Thalassotalea sp. 1_MG-2023]|uniref:LacI family DNA-binding transcriptional regulator n=1 Tax=Thalassotalea sp. 1_MG-2023 TaxID=3062680 RepID=UPI0026E39BC8|nr:LacI family DNA-binding transcriptional regulator [Thalassotalea sp. 1_MG-2023]MDO6428536.1 LacI family DNA-binding transcriptional regulator [Thalassotalea sp. 1_MG-2023]